MNIYNSKSKPNAINILYAYLKRYGIWIALIWGVFFLMFSNMTLPLVLYSILLVPLFIGYGRSYPKNRVVYKVTIDKFNKRIIINSYVLWMHKTIIPFEKLYFECLQKVSSKTNVEQWLIVFGKCPWPIVGTIKSHGDSYWEYEEMNDLAFELHQINRDFSTWRPAKSFSKKPLVSGYKHFKFN